MMTLTNNLKAWQRKEWAFRASWGVARMALAVLAVLATCCFVDWKLDRSRDVPLWFRAFLTLGQLALYSALAYFFLFRLRVPALDDLAARAEEAIPEFGHRLVTALQLNRPDARTAGMSTALIEDCTREAEELSRQHSFAGLIDRSRLEWATALLIPVGLFATAFVVLRPTLTGILLARQLLLPVPIPRDVEVTNVTPELWPAGDEVTLTFDVVGPVDEDTEGTVRVMPEGQPAETFPAKFAARTGEDRARFVAKLPPSSSPFAFRAWIADGRTRSTSNVRFDTRPGVKELAAWVLLPSYVDPEGKRRYERFQPQGEVLAPVDATVRVEALATKPIATATLVLLTRDPKTGTEKDGTRMPMILTEDRTAAVGSFEMATNPSGYRVELVDDNNFANLSPPRRGVSALPDEPPEVELLQEILIDPASATPAAMEDAEVNGMPLADGGQVMIGYRARSPLGISRVNILYKVNDEENYRPLPLSPTTADLAKVGKFLPDLGLFEKSGATGQVEFYSLPSADPENEPSGLQAGGRYNFQTAALSKIGPDKKPAKLEVGDRVEFYVQAYDRNPASGRPPGESRKLGKTVVTNAGLQAWLDARDQSRENLRRIEEKQRAVFAMPATTKP